MSAMFNKSVGKGSIVLKTAVPKANDPMVITIPLTNEAQKLQKGIVRMQCTFDDPDQPKPAAQKPTAADAKPAANEPTKDNKDLKENPPSSGKNSPRAKGSDKGPEKGPEPAAAAKNEPLILKDKTGFLKLNISKIEVHDLVDTGSKIMGFNTDTQDPMVEMRIGKELFSTSRYISY